MITSTDPALWTRAPTTGFRIPVIASMMAAKFKVMENARLHLIVIIIFLDRETRCGSSLMSSFTRAMSAASTAIHFPLRPWQCSHGLFSVQEHR